MVGIVTGDVDPVVGHILTVGERLEGVVDRGIDVVGFEVGEREPIVGSDSDLQGFVAAVDEGDSLSDGCAILGGKAYHVGLHLNCRYADYDALELNFGSRAVGIGDNEYIRYGAFGIGGQSDGDVLEVAGSYVEACGDLRVDSHLAVLDGY